MAYFLKKAKQSKHTYLAIYESFYSPEVKGTKHHCFKSLGSVEKLKESGIEDPINFYQEEVNRLNLEKTISKSKDKIKQISDESPIRHLGYFPLCNILNTLDVEEHFGYMQSNREFQFNVYDIFSSLVYARVVSPNSKHKTFYDVLPCLFHEVDYSYDQLLAAVEFIGSEYRKFVEIFTVATKENYGIETNHTFFDCTNFYFEIDRESDFQKKGPSKEHRSDLIVGLGLLLDANMIPIGMQMYPGNESEKPIIRNIIRDLKKQNNINGRTVQIADKSLNCARNILEALNNNDGYLFSKSVKQLPKKEKNWILLEHDYKDVYDENKKLKYR
ncbi:MAG: transposase, partial [Erysipelotrichaceae bacterium]